jgi:serine/threonine protein kinase
MEDDHLNIFLEYVPGGSVSALLRNYGAFEEPLVKNFARQILEGLNYLHGRGIMHRDIKGANILVDNKGGIKISDFGISKKVETSTSTLVPGMHDQGAHSSPLRRRSIGQQNAPSISSGLRLLDGTRGCQTERSH